MNSFQLSPQQISMLVTGIILVVALYIIIKVVQWLLNRQAENQYTHRSYTQHDEAIKYRSQSRAVPPSAEVVSSSSKSNAVHQQIDAQVLPQDSESLNADVKSNEVPVIVQEVKPTPEPVAVSANHATYFANDPSNHNPRQRSNYSSPFWSTEPNATQKKNLFEDVGEEYPYATGEDYRYGVVTPVLSELLPTTDEGRRVTTKVLRNAGYFEPHAWQNFAALRYLAIILPLLFFGVLLVIAPERFEPYLMAGLVLGPALGWALPALYIRSKATERLRQIENAMPDMLDLLNMCVSQGMNVTQSLTRISSEFAPVYPALSKELQIVAEQARVGSLSQALNNFSDRVDVPEVHSFTSLLIQTEQMGTSVSEALVNYSDSMRESQRQRADEKANAATFKLLFPTVLCLMPAVFLLLMGPPIIELNKFFTRGGVEGLSQQSEEIIQRQQFNANE